MLSNRAMRVPDPLLREEVSARRQLAHGTLVLVGALGLHGTVILVAMLLGQETTASGGAERAPEVVELRYVKPVVVTDIPVPSPSASTAEAPVKKPPVKKPPVKAVAKATPKTAPEPKPAADAVAPEPMRAPPPPTQAPVRRRIVGINFESTVKGGNGPSFAVGNTSMGSTARVATDPNAVGALARRSNQRVSVLSGGGKLVQPRRVGEVEPVYPELLKERAIEGDVVVVIDIAPNGGVLSARVVRSSGQEQLDLAAIDAAKLQQFLPATKDGEPVRYALQYTYKFRLDET